jgi:hypothetical protein
MPGLFISFARASISFIFCDIIFIRYCMEVACGEGVLVTCKGKKGICGVNTGRDEGFAAILLFGFVLRASKYDVGDIGGVRVGGASIF